MRLQMPNADLVLTTNPLLLKTRDLVSQFNSLPPPAAGVSVDTIRLNLLHAIVMAAGTYLTSKPPQPKAKNANRWAGLKNLVEQVGALVVRCGGRTVSGPADFKAIDRHTHSYWLEALDPAHRPGFKLAERFQDWATSPFAVPWKMSFWQFLNGSGADSGVVYLNESERERYRVKLDDKAMLVDSDGDPFGTDRLSTHFSGHGWGIFVVSPTGELYSSSHQVGGFHHSSFLDGRPVMAAGELVVQDGVVKAVTGKSGHYKPTPQNMLEFVRQFRTLPWNAIIRPDMLDVANGGRVKFCYLGDFRARGLAGAATLGKQQVMAALPEWAKGPDAMKTLDLVG